MFESKPIVMSVTDSLSDSLVVAMSRERECTSSGDETPASPPAMAVQDATGASPSTVGSPSPAVAVLEEVDGLENLQIQRPWLSYNFSAI